MLDINFIRENPEKVKEAVTNKQGDASVVDEVLSLAQKRVGLIQRTEELRQERNQIAKADSEENRVRGREIKEELKKLEPELEEVEKEYKNILYKIPNVPFDEVPVGKDESENKVVRKVGEPKKFSFKPKDHLALGEALGIIDVETASKVTGARFGYLKGDAVLLEFALNMFVIGILTNEEKLKEIADKAGLDVNTKPFIPVLPPVMIRPEVFTRMARLDPGQEEERYYLPKDDLYLIGSAEHTLGPMHMDQTLAEKELPIRYLGFSTAFRREAGSYGKDTRGVFRVHQFNKLEMESFTVSEDSKKEQEFIVAIQEHLNSALGLPYQVVEICTGDMGGPDARQIDIETWMPGQDKYRETHTSDLMTDYQARRLGTKVQRKGGEIEFVHMNDATAFAGRTIIAILENYQQEDGSIEIPEVLRPYMGKNRITVK
ncbi:MAG: serine--tRNA ligase [bacterium]|nr:serine--tRNA ligase [bacterium]